RLRRPGVRDERRARGSLLVRVDAVRPAAAVCDRRSAGSVDVERPRGRNGVRHADGTPCLTLADDLAPAAGRTFFAVRPGFGVAHPAPRHRARVSPFACFSRRSIGPCDGPVSDPSPTPLARLLGLQTPDGGFGARAGLPSSTEATALAALA